MSLINRRSLLGLGWVFVVYATLQIHHLDLNLGHGICGAWGCGPPVEALISIHGFWFVLLVPVMLLLGRWLSRSVARRIGRIAFAVGLLGILTYVGWDLKTFFANNHFTQYWLQRIGFTLATWTQYPVWQVAAGGLAMLIQQRFRHASTTPPEPRTEQIPSHCEA